MRSHDAHVRDTSVSLLTGSAPRTYRARRTSRARLHSKESLVSFSRSRVLRAAVGAACATALFPLPALAADLTARRRRSPPYVKGAAPGVDVTSVLTVGDQPAENGYRMVGIPDGLGVRIDRELGVAEVTMNHELRPDRGAVRAHGQTGAFVSRFRINPNERVYSGYDLIKRASPSGTTSRRTTARRPRLAARTRAAPATRSRRRARLLALLLRQPRDAGSAQGPRRPRALGHHDVAGQRGGGRRGPHLRRDR